MGFKFVLLWTDVALWLLFATLAGYAWRVSRHEHLRATWEKVLRDPAALCSAVVLMLFIGVTALDSVHIRRELAFRPGQAAGQVFHDTRTLSVLDLLLERQLEMRETTYSRPLAYVSLTKQSIERNGQTVREFAPEPRRRASTGPGFAMGCRHHRTCGHGRGCRPAGRVGSVPARCRAAAAQPRRAESGAA